MTVTLPEKQTHAVAVTCLKQCYVPILTFKKSSRFEFGTLCDTIFNFYITPKGTVQVAAKHKSIQGLSLGVLQTLGFAEMAYLGLLLMNRKKCCSCLSGVRHKFSMHPKYP